MRIIRRLPGLLYPYRCVLYAGILALVLLYILFKWNFICTNIEAWHHVKQMCDQYEKRNAVGSLCRPLCKTKEIHSLTCHSFQSKAVFSAQWHNARFVFKSATGNELKLPTERAFSATVKGLVKNKLNLTLTHDSFMRLSQYTEEQTKTQMDNLWILVQDNEYLLSTIYSDKDVFPQIFGTCGPYFAAEYLEPLQETSVLTISDNKEDWVKRLKISVQILELLDELEGSFQEQLYLCDIKLKHFAFVSTDNKLKFIDLHKVHPKSIVSKIIANKTCKTDEECDYLDCRARCGINGKCNAFVANSNLQIICEKIFLGWRVSNTILVPGLLMSQHTPSELASVLRQCANPEGETGKPRTAPDEDIKTRLYNILSEMEQTVNNDFF